MITRVCPSLTNVSAKACAATSQSDQRTLAARRATTAQIPVLRVPCIPNDVVDSFATHEGMRDGSLAVQGRSHVTKLSDDLTLIVALFTSAGLAFEVANPAYIAHMGVHAAHN